MVYWAPREREVVMEEDIIQNFELMKDYVFVVGHETPLPHQLDHEASGLHAYASFFSWQIQQDCSKSGRQLSSF